MTDPIEFFKIANNLSIDFVNTLVADDGREIELLNGFENVISWGIAMKLLSKEQVKKLSTNRSNPTENAEFLSQAREFRRILFKMFEEIEKGQVVKTSTVETINKILRNQVGFPEIEETENGFMRRYRAEFTEPYQLLVPIAESAADLLCFGNLANVKKCESEKCVLYFYDTSKNHSRRWCSMSHCGNRAKAARFYQHKKART